MVMVPEGQDTQEATTEAQQLLQNDDNNDNNNDDHDNGNHDNDNDHENDEEDDNEDEDEDDEDYTPLRDFEKEKLYREADEIKTSRNEALIPTGRLWNPLSRINITTALEFRIKIVPCPGREEYRAVVEIFNEPSVISQHMGPAFRATYQDVVADAAWQAATTYNRTHHDKLKNSIYHLLPQRKKDKFKTSGVKADVPRMVMVHQQDVSLEMSISLQATQREIQSLRNPLRDLDATIRGYQKMLAGEASDLYASDTYTW
jgi:hypothetical protein